MNKERVNALLPIAYDSLSSVGIAQNGEIVKSYRGQVSSFGAAISNGSLLAAVAAFSAQQSASVHREKIPEAINRMLKAEWTYETDGGTLKEKVYDGTVGRSLFETVRNAGNLDDLQERILDCAIALKLAMNLYKLVKEKNNSQTPEKNGEEASA